MLNGDTLPVHKVDKTLALPTSAFLSSEVTVKVTFHEVESFDTRRGTRVPIFTSQHSHVPR